MTKMNALPTRVSRAMTKPVKCMCIHLGKRLAPVVIIFEISPRRFLVSFILRQKQERTNSKRIKVEYFVRRFAKLFPWRGTRGKLFVRYKFAQFSHFSAEEILKLQDNYSNQFTQI